MKFILFFFVTILFSPVVQAQTDSLKRIQEINKQVWKPFIISFTSRNNLEFKKLHSKRITRVEIDNNMVEDYEKYFPPVENNLKPDNSTRLFELRFDKRIGNENKAWESGYYKGTVLRPGKDNRVYFGRFFVLLEKEDGVWKILLDADTGKGATEANFNSAGSMQ